MPNKSKVGRRCLTALVALILLGGCAGGNGNRAGSPTASLSTSSEGSGSPTASPSTSSETSASASTPATPVRAGRIVFRRYAEGSENLGSLFVDNTDGSAERRLTDGADKGFLDDHPTWSPDGKQVIFERLGGLPTVRESHRIAVVSAAGTGLRYLTPGAIGKVGTIIGFDGDPAFSPDGTQIVYTHAEGVVKNDQIPHSDVMLMSSDGSHKRRVTNLPAFAGDVGGPRWSPDGKLLLYSLFTDRSGTPANSSALFVIGVDGSAPRQLTPWALGAGGTAAWSRSGLIAFRAVQDEESGVGNFYTIHPDGSGLTQVTHFDGQTISHQVGISRDGQWIVFSKQDRTSGLSALMIARLGGPDVYAVGAADRTGSSPDWDPAS